MKKIATYFLLLALFANSHLFSAKTEAEVSQEESNSISQDKTKETLELSEEAKQDIIAYVTKLRDLFSESLKMILSNEAITEEEIASKMKQNQEIIDFKKLTPETQRAVAFIIKLIIQDVLYFKGMPCDLTDYSKRVKVEKQIQDMFGQKTFEEIQRLFQQITSDLETSLCDDSLRKLESLLPNITNFKAILLDNKEFFEKVNNMNLENAVELVNKLQELLSIFGQIKEQIAYLKIIIPKCVLIYETVKKQILNDPSLPEEFKKPLSEFIDEYQKLLNPDKLMRFPIDNKIFNELNYDESLIQQAKGIGKTLLEIVEKLANLTEEEILQMLLDSQNWKTEIKDCLLQLIEQYTTFISYINCWMDAVMNATKSVVAIPNFELITKLKHEVEPTAIEAVA